MVLSDLLSQYTELIPVVTRFGVRLGVGVATIEQICREKELNFGFILTVLNVYLDEYYEPGKELEEFDVSLIADYLKKTEEYYLQVAVPNLEKHLMPFIAMGGRDREELQLLKRIFFQFQSELSDHLQQGLRQLNDYPNELLNDLKKIMIRHISGNINQNLAHAVIFSITALEKEMSVHNRLLQKVLRPKVNELDLSRIKHLDHLFADEQKQRKPNKKLTKREVEVLKQIVQGHLNKEIADELNISINTVLSHRKNIIAKTGIRTVSGLTFYSISNGYISPGDYHIN